MQGQPNYACFPPKQVFGKKLWAYMPPPFPCSSTFFHCYRLVIFLTPILGNFCANHCFFF